ncbi:HAD-IA family hydrolase [Paenibacillus sp. TRM 82003]|nr:HAD-IA family hydrolase [Paenibacillus sp. TRM 82003]
MVKALIFDFDGTIIDTETAWYIAFRDAYKKHDVELTLEMYSQCIGTSLHSFNPYEYLKTHLQLPIDLAEFRRSVRAHHAELMLKEEMRPGILQFLQSAKAAGLKIGLATSSERSWIEPFLDRLRIRDYFECIRTADDVKRVKPDPELYAQALACLGVQPNEAIALEDSPNGAKAAMAAGMYCVLVPNTITKLLAFEEVHRQAESLADFDFHALLADIGS